MKLYYMLSLTLFVVYLVYAELMNIVEYDKVPLTFIEIYVCSAIILNTFIALGIFIYQISTDRFEL